MQFDIVIVFNGTSARAISNGTLAKKSKFVCNPTVHIYKRNNGKRHVNKTNSLRMLSCWNETCC